jgi:proteasome component ECM29
VDARASSIRCLILHYFSSGEAFSHLTGDPNDLTQYLASQGMRIVYELGDASMKQGLVHALVGTLTSTGKRKIAIKVNILH